MSEIDFRSFDALDDDEQKICNDRWVPCRICQEAFFRLRLTMRYCNTCKRAFCEGEHGFAGRGPAVCIQCHRPTES
jgi:hypothetical protein